MIRARMPSPIGHSLAGVITAWAADLVPGDRGWRTAAPPAAWYTRAGDGLTLVCAALAALPDIDLALPTGAHRAYTHSLGAAILATIIAGAVTARVTPRRTVRVALMCGAAYATHVLLDWMAVDDTFPYGIRALWPFSSGWYISGWDLFAGTARRRLLSPTSTVQNLRAVTEELVILLPIAWAVWLVRVKALARLSSEVPGGDHSTQ